MSVTDSKAVAPPAGPGHPPAGIGEGGDQSGEWVWRPISGSGHEEGDDERVSESTSESMITENDRSEPGKRFDVTFSKIKNLSEHGVILDKLLVWMDIQKDMIPSDSWKAHLKTLFTDEEVIDAKAALFEAVGGENSRIGKFKNHQGNDKGILKHVDDLIEAAGKLWEKNEMPLLVASSKMVKGMRNYNMVDANTVNIADAIDKMKQVENTLKACLNENTLQVKTLSETVQNIGQGSSSFTNLTRTPSGRVASLVTEKANGITGSSQSKKRKVGSPAEPIPGISSLPPPPAHPSTQTLYPPLPPSDRELSWSTIAGQHRQNPRYDQGQGQVRQVADQTGGRDVRPSPAGQRGAWKRSLNLLHGTADSSNTLAADVSLVAYGVARDASAQQLKEFLESKNINVIECKNLTTWDQARTHCYKVTIKASEYEKATKPDVWPYRVGVRLFKQFREKRENENPSWNAQTRNENNQPNLSAPAAPVRPLLAPVKTPVLTSNRFSVLDRSDQDQEVLDQH